MDTMIIAYSLNRSLYKWLPLTLNSLLTHNPNCKVYIFCEDDTIDTITDARVTFINVDNYPPFNIGEHYNTYVLSRMTFVRLWMANVIPESRIIYLDVDTIIDGSLEELWNTDLKGKTIGGVFDAYPSFSGFNTLYINAGVLLMDLDKWRQYNLTERTRQILCTHKFRLADQDALNFLGNAYIKYLDLKWNYQLNQPAQIEIAQPIIYHYAAHPKLWESIPVRHWNDYYKEKL